MNILPCLILCTSFAACLSGKLESVAGNYYLSYNGTLYEYLLSQKENPNLALYYTYEVLGGLLTEEIKSNLTGLMEFAMGELNDYKKPNGLLGSTCLTSNEYLCYCSLYVEKIRWIREALKQRNYSLKDIMGNIAALTGTVRCFAIYSGRWYNSVEENKKNYPPKIRELVTKIVGSINSLLQSQWAITAACERIYPDFQNGCPPLYKECVSTLGAFMKGYERGKEFWMTGDELRKCRGMSREEFINHLKMLYKKFEKRYSEYFYEPDKCFQEGLNTIPGTPLVFPDDGKERKAQIAGKISTGTVRKFNIAGKEPEAGVSALKETKDQGAGSSAKAHPTGKKYQERLQKKNKNKKSKLAVNQKPDGIGTKGIEAKAEEAKARESKSEIEEHQISEEAAEQMPEQQKPKTIKQMPKQEEPKTARQVREEAKEMFEHTGGMKDDHARKQEMLEEFVVLHDKLDEGSTSITYKKLRALFISPVWSWCGIDDLGNLMTIHRPHNGANWNSNVRGAILDLCKDKWDTLKGYPSYARVAIAIKKCKMGKENDQK